jgi:hypothetical protein
MCTNGGITSDGGIPPPYEGECVEAVSSKEKVIVLTWSWVWRSLWAQKEVEGYAVNYWLVVARGPARLRASRDIFFQSVGHTDWKGGKKVECLQSQHGPPLPTSQQASVDRHIWHSHAIPTCSMKFTKLYYSYVNMEWCPRPSGMLHAEHICFIFIY